MTGLRPPADCVRWCQAQDYGISVDDDLAAVDLDWWNTRLKVHKIPVRLWGRTIDGTPTDRGDGYLRRGDINGSSLPSSGPADLNVLYRAAAWLSAHPYRSHVRRFPDVRTPRPGSDFTVIATALQQCRDHHPDNLNPGPYRSWSGWPRTPGVGPGALTLYCWAVHAASGTGERPQLLDQYSLATLCHLGWLEIPSLPTVTRTRYLRFNHLLHDWATQIHVPAELIEMWLAHSWHQRTRRSPAHPVITDQR